MPHGWWCGSITNPTPTGKWALLSFFSHPLVSPFLFFFLCPSVWHEQRSVHRQEGNGAAAASTEGAPSRGQWRSRPSREHRDHQVDALMLLGSCAQSEVLTERRCFAPSPLVRRNKIENWRRQSEKKKRGKGKKRKKREFFLMWVPFVSQSRGIDNTTSASMWHTTSAPCRMPERRWLCWTGMTHFGKF